MTYQTTSDVMLELTVRGEAGLIHTSMWTDNTISTVLLLLTRDSIL